MQRKEACIINTGGKYKYLVKTELYESKFLQFNWNLNVSKHIFLLWTLLRMELYLFRTTALMHCQGQRLLAHMSHLDSFTLLFQQWDTWAMSLWSSSNMCAHQHPGAFKSEAIKLSRGEVHLCGRLPMMNCLKLQHAGGCMRGIPKGVNPAKETLV